MKLVDILARELTEWAGDVGAITQDKLTGELFDYYHCPLRGGNEREVSSIADDAGEAHYGASGAAVTRAEWQAAVDALNAPKVVEWDGSGDPPQMSKIEYKSVEGIWKLGVFVGRVYGKIVAGCDDTEVVGWLGSDEIRPIRTAAQVAAEERENAIDEMSGWAGKTEINPATERVILERLYDAGYRKEPKSCGS